MLRHVVSVKFMLAQVMTSYVRLCQFGLGYVWLG